MDVQLISSSVLDLPSSHRVDAIVHDGTTDLRTWPGPGPDRDLSEHYGPELNRVLQRERERLDGGALGLGEMVRLHRGKLHCDFLLWVATRPPENVGVQAPAPNAATLTKAVKDALTFASERHVSKVAFGPLGAGPDALDDADRLIVVAKAANAYYDECFQAGRAAGIEEVLVCHPHTSKISVARRALGRSVKVAAPPKPTPSTRTTTAKKKTTRRKTTRKPRIATLSEDQVAEARASAGPYDRTVKYEVGQYFIHSKFGIGRVEELTPEGFINVLFEGGVTKRLLHNRP